MTKEEFEKKWKMRDRFRKCPKCGKVAHYKAKETKCRFCGKEL